MNIVIAGGSGVVGSHLYDHLSSAGHQIKILSRHPKNGTQVFWNPSEKKIDHAQVQDTEVIINLCGVGIGDKRWTRSRKEELESSRTEPIEFLFEIRHQFPNLKHFISSSGINCYGYTVRAECYSEDDEYGNTFVDQLVKTWEESAMQFSNDTRTTIMRFGVVLTERGGAIPKLMKPIKLGFGAALGSGEQIIPWIHYEDLSSFVEYSITQNIEGTFNLCAGNSSNKELTITLAKKMGKRIWLPNVPKFVVKLLFGEMSDLLLNGVCVSNKKAKDSGYTFKYSSLTEAVNQI